MTKQLHLILCLILSCLLLFAACNSMFYYPSTDKVYNEVIAQTHIDDFIDSGSGNKIHYYYFTAENPKGLIVYFHGNSRNINASFRNFLWAVDKGYELIVWDYSGYGKSTGKSERAAINQDAHAILSLAVKIKKEKRYSLITVGQSLGGAVMLGSLGGFKDRNEINIILADCTFASYKKIGKQKMWDFICMPKLFSFGIDDDFAPYKSFHAIKDIPIIISHCREDTMVPFSFGEELYNTLESKEKYFLDPTCRHTKAYWREPDQNNLLLLFDEILQKTKNEAPADKNNI